MDLLKPRSVRGFASAQTPSALPDGILASAENVRLGDGAVRARWGDASIATGLSGTLRGAFECSLDGTPYLFRAAGDGSKVSIYRSTDGVSWTDISPSSGPYGDTRLTDSATTPVRFCVVRDNPGLAFETYDCLVIQNGVDAPRLYAKAVTGSTAFTPGEYGMAVVTQPPILEGSFPTFYVSQYLAESFTIDGASSTTFSSTGTGLTLSDSAASPNNTLRLTLDHTTYAAGATATCVFSFALDFTGKTAAISAVRSSDSDFWSQVQVEIGDSGGHWDTLTQSFAEPLNGPGTEAYAQILLRLPPVTVTTLTDIDRIRLSWIADAPGTTKTGDMLTFSAEGVLPAGAQFGVAYYGTDSRALGPMGAITSVIAPNIQRCGGSETLSSVLMGASDIFLYDQIVHGYNTTEALRDHGVDRCFIYRRDGGETDYYLEGSRLMAVWNGAGWTFSVGSAETTVPVVPIANDTDRTRPGIDAAGLVLPPGTAMAVANARTWVGSGQRLYIGDADRPFTFRLAADVSDAGSGTSIGFSGQSVKAIVPLGAFGAAAEDLSSPVAGVASVYVLTDRNLWQLSGFTVDSLSRPIPVAPYGTLSPLSVGRSRLGFYWLDDKGQVCYFSPQGLQRLSVSLVDDKTTGIPASRKTWASGACANDRYYLGYTPSDGATNTACLVWNEQTDTWESADTATSGSFETLVPFYDSGYVKLLRFGTTSLHEHEQPSSTNVVNLSLVFQEVGGYGQAVAAADMSVAMDSTSGVPVALTTRRYFPESGISADGTISVTPTTSRIWEFDNLGAGGEGWTVQPSIFGTLPGGTRIYSATLEVKAVPQGPQRNG
jgi:hypothetical protein